MIEPTTSAVAVGSPEPASPGHLAVPNREFGPTGPSGVRARLLTCQPTASTQTPPEQPRCRDPGTWRQQAATPRGRSGPAAARPSRWWSSRCRRVPPVRSRLTYGPAAITTEKASERLRQQGPLSLPRPVQARGDVSHQTGGPSGRQYQARPGLSVQHVADGVVDGAARRVVGSGTAGDGRPVVWPPDPPSPRRIIHSATGNAAFPWRVLNCARPVPHRQAGLPGQAVRAGGQPASKTPMNRAASAGRTGRRAARAGGPHGRR